jgi:hypothetical protein
MNMRTRFILVFVFTIVMSATSNSFAAIYKYVDANGIICFSDDLQSIPEQCRATAKIVSGNQEDKPDRTIQNQPSAKAEDIPGAGALSVEGETGSTGGHVKSLFSSRMMISLIVIVSSMFAFVILGILDIGHKKATKVIRVVIVWGMSVYLIVAHAGDVVHMFKTLGDNVDTAQRASAEKGKKAAKAMKDMNNFMQQIDNTPSQESGGVEPGNN